MNIQQQTKDEKVRIWKISSAHEANFNTKRYIEERKNNKKNIQSIFKNFFLELCTRQQTTNSVSDDLNSSGKCVLCYLLFRNWKINKFSAEEGRNNWTTQGKRWGAEWWRQNTSDLGSLCSFWALLLDFFFLSLSFWPPLVHLLSPYSPIEFYLLLILPCGPLKRRGKCQGRDRLKRLLCCLSWNTRKQTNKQMMKQTNRPNVIMKKTKPCSRDTALSLFFLLYT